jgi:hypothetical protein
LQADQSAHVKPSASAPLYNSQQGIQAGSTADNYSRFERVEARFAKRGDLAAGCALAGCGRDVHRKEIAQLTGRGVSIKERRTVHDDPPVGPKRSVLMRDAS